MAFYLSGFPWLDSAWRPNNVLKIFPRGSAEEYRHHRNPTLKFYRMRALISFLFLFSPDLNFPKIYPVRQKGSPRVVQVKKGRHP